MSEPCAYVLPEGRRCAERPFDHVHQPLPCVNGKPERHHDYMPQPPHRHKFDRCDCGLRRKSTS